MSTFPPGAIGVSPAGQDDEGRPLYMVMYSDPSNVDRPGYIMSTSEPMTADELRKMLGDAEIPVAEVEKMIARANQPK